MGCAASTPAPATAETKTDQSKAPAAAESKPAPAPVQKMDAQPAAAPVKEEGKKAEAAVPAAAVAEEQPKAETAAAAKKKDRPSSAPGPAGVAAEEAPAAEKPKTAVAEKQRPSTAPKTAAAVPTAAAAPVTGALPTDQTYAMIKPGNEANWGNAMAAIIAAGFEVERAKVLTMDAGLVNTFYAEHIGKGFFETLSAYMTSGPVLALHLRLPAAHGLAVPTWRTLIGPTNLEKAKAEAPTSLRALYGRSGTENFAHGSDADASAQREIGIIFGEDATNTASPLPPSGGDAEGAVERTYAMIKPGFVPQWGAVLTCINAEGFRIVQMRRTCFTQKDVDAFYAEHVGKGFFETLAAFMTSGPILALCLEREGAIARWRSVLGPTNLEKAKAEAPTSLRALYAKSTTENLCHGSDAVESAQREINFLFGPQPLGA